MRTAGAHALFALSFVWIAGCVGPQEDMPPPECPASRAHLAAHPQAAQTEVAQHDDARPDPAFFAGHWAGRGCQSDGPCWTVRVAIQADERGRPMGTIAYPSVPCEARLEFVQWEVGEVAVFRERFEDAGKCVPDGYLRLRLLDNDSVGFEWSFPDGRVDAATTLDRMRAGKASGHD